MYFNGVAHRCGDIRVADVEAVRSHAERIPEAVWPQPLTFAVEFSFEMLPVGQASEDCSQCFAAHLVW